MVRAKFTFAEAFINQREIVVRRYILGIDGQGFLEALDGLIEPLLLRRFIASSTLRIVGLWLPAITSLNCGMYSKKS